MGEEQLYSEIVDSHHRPVHSLVDSRRSHLGLARSLSVSTDPYERACAYGSASKFLCVGPALLVGSILRPPTEELWRGGAVRIHYRCPHKRIRSAAYLRAACLVSGIHDNHPALGSYSAGRSTAWRADYVGSRQPRLSDCRTGALRRVVERKRRDSAEGFSCEVDAWYRLCWWR